MYLSKLTFNPNAQGKVIGHFKWDNLYTHHQMVWNCFTGEGYQLEQADFVFRVDQLSRIPVIQILSQRPVEQELNGWKVESVPFNCEFNTEQLLQFSLRVNPTIDIPREGKRSARHDVLMHAKTAAKRNGNDPVVEMDQAAKNWLIKRQQRLGIQLLEHTLEIANYKQHSFIKSQEQKVSISTLDYQGVLKVTDPAKFQQALFKGIGRAKAFGCGLMLIRRI